MSNPTITAVIIAKDESKMIANCIETLRWCDQILVIDNGSIDNTEEIAKELGAKVVSFASNNFSQLRNKAFSFVKTDWLFYVDADERVTPNLSKEILVHMETDSASALIVNRENVNYGQKMVAGGWQNDQLTRVFKRTALQNWHGIIHETAKYTGEAKQLHHPLIHLTHRNTIDGLVKTVNWTPMEAELLYKSGAKPVTLATLFRKGLMEFIRRAVFKKGYQDGMVGWIEAIIQGFNRVLVYIQVWELQQDPPIEEKYQQKELEIVDLWKKAK